MSSLRTIHSQAGLQALLLTAAELKEAGWRRVDENYASYVPVRAAWRNPGWVTGGLELSGSAVGSPGRCLS